MDDFIDPVYCKTTMTLNEAEINALDSAKDSGQLIKNMTQMHTKQEMPAKRKKSVEISDSRSSTNSATLDDPGFKHVVEQHFPHQQQQQPNSEPVTKKSDTSGLGQVTYTQLQSTISIDPSEHPGSYGPGRESINFPIEDSIYETLLVFVISFYNIFFSLLIAYWHYQDGKFTEANQTLAILFISSITIQLVYAFNRNIKKANIWDESKIFAILSVIPGSLTTIMSFADFVFSIQEARDRSFTRAWSNTRMVYLVEALLLAFPQCVLQSVLLVQDPESIPNVKGLFVLFSMGLMTMGIALARIRYDTSRRPERFGTGIDKIIRSTIVWGNKGLWVSTYVLLVVTIQLRCPENMSAVIFSILALQVLYEVPILVSSINSARKYIGRISGLFFVLPQFASLLILIVWTNTDPNVYTSNVGICALGAFSWFESVAIIGWLLDGCSDREMDILPLYPHFFGDVYSRWCGKH